MTTGIHHILFITLSNIGDAVMTTAVLERLHQLYPRAAIDIVADRRSSELFSHCPYRGRIVHKEKPGGWRRTLELIKTLRRCRYDLIVDLRTDGLAWLLKGRRRLTKWRHKPYGPHAVQDLIGIIDRINPGQQIPATRLWLAESERQQATHLLATRSGNRLVALGPGANWEPKIWPLESFRNLARQLTENVDDLVLLGGPGDRERCGRLAQEAGFTTINLCGSTTLLEAAAVLQQCRLFIGNDSGLGHLAAAVGTPTLTLFGPGRPERYHPWGEHSRWLRGAGQDLNQLEVGTVLGCARDMLA